MSEMQNRPPGRSTRNISAKAGALSGSRFSTQLLTIASMLPLSTGRCSISPSRNSTLSNPSLRALARARAIMSGVISTPITRPSAPTSWRAMNTSLPAPEPRSSTVSPTPQRRVLRRHAAAEIEVRLGQPPRHAGIGVADHVQPVGRHLRPAAGGGGGAATAGLPRDRAVAVAHQCANRVLVLHRTGHRVLLLSRALASPIVFTIIEPWKQIKP